MSFGTYGWIGKFMRLFGMPDGSVDDEVSRPQRARFRYNHPLDRLEVSKDGGPYVQVQDGPDIDDYGIAADTTALSAEDDTVLGDGAVFYVRSLRDEFVLDKSSTLTADGITVVATSSSTGRWIRRILGDQRWRDQTDWYVDENGGDDENDGASAATALATYAEFERRLGSRPITSFYDVNLQSDITEPLRVTLRSALSDARSGQVGRVRLFGQTTTVLSTLTLSSVTAHDNATTQMGSVTVAGHDFSTQLGRRIEVVTGAAAGAKSYVGNASSVDTARTGAFWDSGTFAETFPAGGDDVEVQQLTQIDDLQIGSGCAVQLTDLHVLALGGGPGSQLISLDCRVDDLTLWGTRWLSFGGSMGATGDTCKLDQDCLVQFDTMLLGGGDFEIAQSFCTMLGTFSCLGSVSGAPGGTFQIQVRDQSILRVDGSLAWDDNDSTAGRGQLDVFRDAAVHASGGTMWATNWATTAGNPAYHVRSGCQVTYPSGSQPTSAPGDDIDVAGNAGTMSIDLPFAPAGTLAGIIVEA